MAFDPTHTSRLRQIARGELQRRIRTLLTATREMLLENNSFGALQQVNHPMMAYDFFRRTLSSASGAQLDMFTNWFNNAAYAMVVGQGLWLRSHIDRAFQHGLDAGEKITKIKMIESTKDVYYTLYKNELEGIVDATVQMATRAISTGLINRERPATLYRRIVSVVMKVLEPRSRSLAHNLIVQQHNVGLLVQFKNAGHTHVGVIPEKLQRKIMRRDHAHVHDQDANVLTAGDDDVCQDCEDYAAAGPYSIDEVESELPLHPNCRCSWTPTENLKKVLALSAAMLALLASRGQAAPPEGSVEEEELIEELEEELEAEEE